MASRIGGWLITGPAAFLVGGMIDVALYAAASARARLSRTGSRMKPPGSVPAQVS